ncbi:MAG: hypothetical protein ABL888_10145 [Pirellulaceae bacterium]
MTDPREPLYGKRLRIESIARTDPRFAHVFLRTEDDVVLRVPLRATSLSTLVDHSPRATLNTDAVVQFLELAKEYALCRAIKNPKSTRYGHRSTNNNGKMS